LATQTSAKPTQGVWGRAPKENTVKSILLFPEKEAKSVCSASQKTIGYPNLGEADPGGLGASPQGKHYWKYSSFSRKRSKKRLFRFVEDNWVWNPFRVLRVS
jgi:hypothetical protein